MKYKVMIRQVYTHVVEVEATDVENAKDLVWTKVEDGSAVYDADTLVHSYNLPPPLWTVAEVVDPPSDPPTQ